MRARVVNWVVWVAVFAVVFGLVSPRPVAASISEVEKVLRRMIDEGEIASSAGTAGASFAADPIVLDDGTGNVTYLAPGLNNGQLRVGQTDGTTTGQVYAAGYRLGEGGEGYWLSGQLLLPSTADLRWSSTTNATASADVELYRAGSKAFGISDGDLAHGNFVAYSDTSPRFDVRYGSSTRARIGASGWYAVAGAGGYLSYSSSSSDALTPVDLVLGRLSESTYFIAGDATQTTAAKLAVSGIAPMGSTVNVNDDVHIFDANGDQQVLVDTSAETIYFTPGNSGTTRMSINDSSNGLSIFTNVTGQSGNHSLFGFLRSTFAYSSDSAVSAGNSGMVSHNNGAVGTVTLSLPAGTSTATGNWHTFLVQENQVLRIDPAAADKILDTDMTGLLDGEYITSSTVNSTITIMLTSDDDWVVLGKTGTWAEEAP